ncbi:MAG: hypothetical protein HKN21_10965 [Candidatus Eisenbacteria bacterium]|uniref:Uncharacterized protein n=1 Tax=Eiseniibacteriota bacterium TaxID=2212470 RepID=A0A7Y2E9X6_UNCEI|nr:hypothetical protein [Candidatus Eisenbacteria bacterium]
MEVKAKVGATNTSGNPQLYYALIHQVIKPSESNLGDMGAYSHDFGIDNLNPACELADGESLFLVGGRGSLAKALKLHESNIVRATSGSPLSWRVSQELNLKEAAKATKNVAKLTARNRKLDYSAYKHAKSLDPAAAVDPAQAALWSGMKKDQGSLFQAFKHARQNNKPLRKGHALSVVATLKNKYTVLEVAAGDGLEHKLAKNMVVFGVLLQEVKQGMPSRERGKWN